MQAPSAVSLRIWRAFARPELSRQCLGASCRQYASTPPPPPPPKALKSAREQPAIRSPLAQPGFRLRGRKDDDEEFIPQPLARPIGIASPPLPGENMGIDFRSLQQRRDDFVDYDKHLERRKAMSQQIAKPYFRDWSNLRFHKGKMFTSPDRLFKSDVSLWFPNFYGKTLQKGQKKMLGTGDGYGGLGRNSCEAMQGKISVVSVLSNQWSQSQVDTFCAPEQNPELQKVLEESPDVAQRVWIHRENNFLRWWLVQLFRSNIRNGKSVEEQSRYFMVRRGISDEMKEAIGLLNDSVGYIYLVDPDNKIRWAGNAVAEPAEKESMVKGLRRLIEEVKMSRKTTA